MLGDGSLGGWLGAEAGGGPGRSGVRGRAMRGDKGGERDQEVAATSVREWLGGMHAERGGGGGSRVGDGRRPTACNRYAACARWGRRGAGGSGLGQVRVWGWADWVLFFFYLSFLPLLQ